MRQRGSSSWLLPFLLPRLEFQRRSGPARFRAGRRRGLPHRCVQPRVGVVHPASRGCSVLPVPQLQRRSPAPGDAAGLGSSTLVVFLSDNGAPTEPNGSLNTPLRGGKEELSEGGIRVPFIVRWDGRIPAGLEYGDPVIQLDVLPTALAAAGIAAPVDREIDGVNLIPRLDGTGAGAPHAVLFWRYGEPSAVRRGDWKLLSPGTGPGGACRLAGAVAAPAALTASNPAD